MDYNREEHRRQNPSITSIDKVLDYVEQDLEDPTKDKDMLIDVHALLSKMKAHHLKTSTKPSTEDDLFVYSYMITNSFTAVFGAWDAHTTVIDGRVLIHNEIVYMEINRDDGFLKCIVSFYHQTSPIVVAEVINTLKDLFGAGLKVSGELFTTDEATGKYIWGIENIQQYLRNINGHKIKPIIFFDDGTVGNS